MSDPVHVARAKIGNAVKKRDAAAERAARRELTAAYLERAIHAALTGEYRLTPTEHERLSAVLAEGGERS